MDNKFLLKYKFKGIVLEYIDAYIDIICSLNILPKNANKDELIKRVMKRLKEVKFFEDDDPITLKEGNKFRGLTTNDDYGNISIYLRNSDKDKELAFYHELTHMLTMDTNYFGLILNDYIGPLINEPITQYIAQAVYYNKYNLKFKNKEYNSEDIRLLPGIKINSDLTSYQAFDELTSLYLKFKGYTREDAIEASFSYNLDRIEDFYYTNNNYINEKVLMAFNEIFLTDLYYYTGNKFIVDRLENNLPALIPEGIIISRETQKQKYLEARATLKKVL